jgi:hypothetical protein
MRASVAGLAFGVLVAGSAFGQYVISAHSGVVQYVEGSAYLNDNQVEPKIGQLPDIKEKQVFRTEQGKAEVLLTPGVFLRLAENSSIRMVSAKLTDTRVEVLTGSAMVECDDLAKDNSIMLLHKGNTILLVKHGLYRVDADAGLFKVYDGEAIVKADSGQLTLKKGKQSLLTGALMAENFDPKADDELYRWSDRRSGYLAKANVSSANSLSSSYSGYGGYGGYGAYGGGWSGWQFNPMFGLYTYVPYDGYLFSPFGYGFWSPYTVWQAPYYYGNGGGGGGVGGVSRSGSSTGKHTPFIPSRGSSASHGAASAARGGAAAASGGGVARGGGFSGGTAHAAAAPAATVSRGGR